MHTCKSDYLPLLDDNILYFPGAAQPEHSSGTRLAREDRWDTE